MNRAVYPAYLRDQVDYDYLGKLSDAERQWLGAFTEEYLKGWCLRGETQVLSLRARRETWAAQKRLRKHRDPLAFGQYRSGLQIDSTLSGRGTTYHGINGKQKNEETLQAAWNERSTVPGQDEDETIRAIDQKRRRRRDRR